MGCRNFFPVVRKVPTPGTESPSPPKHVKPGFRSRREAGKEDEDEGEEKEGTRRRGRNANAGKYNI